jgi:hypothetical protein
MLVDNIQAVHIEGFSPWLAGKCRGSDVVIPVLYYAVLMLRGMGQS